MAIKRVISTSFWTDDKVIDLFSPDDKLFMLYLLTNPHSTQLGIYAINKRLMSFEIGYEINTIAILLERFEKTYKMICISEETNEIAILNFLKHSIISGGKPVEDLLIKEAKAVKNIELIRKVYLHLKGCQEINETVKSFFKKIFLFSLCLVI